MEDRVGKVSRRSVLAAAGTLGVTVAGARAGRAAVPERPGVEGHECADRIYVPRHGAWDGVSPGVESLADFETRIGRTTAIYHEFLILDSAFPSPEPSAAIDGGRMYLFSLAPKVDQAAST